MVKHMNYSTSNRYCISISHRTLYLSNATIMKAYLIPGILLLVLASSSKAGKWFYIVN